MRKYCITHIAELVGSSNNRTFSQIFLSNCDSNDFNNYINTHMKLIQAVDILSVPTTFKMSSVEEPLKIISKRYKSQINDYIYISTFILTKID